MKILIFIILIISYALPADTLVIVYKNLGTTEADSLFIIAAKKDIAKLNKMYDDAYIDGYLYGKQIFDRRRR